MRKRSMVDIRFAGLLVATAATHGLLLSAEQSKHFGV